MLYQLINLILFGIVAAFTPGPNNISAAYSGFNFGFRKTIPLMLGVILGWTTLLILMELGLIIVFNKVEYLQSIIKVCGSLFLIYLAYKIAFSNLGKNSNLKKPIKFLDMFLFQFINPKSIVISMTVVSTFIDAQNNYLRDVIIVTLVGFLMAVFSISSWCLLGKYLRRFVTSENFIKNFNYTMSFLLIVCVIMFYV
tara:strand:- start:1387 stop:1977 length:591 start_codon:yes stop_codon:yes gene_type:complete